MHRIQRQRAPPGPAIGCRHVGMQADCRQLAHQYVRMPRYHPSQINAFITLQMVRGNQLGMGALEEAIVEVMRKIGNGAGMELLLPCVVIGAAIACAIGPEAR